VAWTTTAAGRPAELRATARASDEPDYRSFSGALGATVELARRNLAISAFVGAGADDVLPVEAPPGQGDEWPADHRRVTAGASFSQLLSPSAMISAAVGATWQRGRLASPYRRALVRTSLFPEVHPEERDRATGYLGLSFALDAASALHLRYGLYRDSWGVVAIIPEVAVARELAGDRGLVSLRYRYYHQWAADFYQARYQEVEAILTGDHRLGPIVDHTAGVELRWRLRERVTVDAVYEISICDYQDLATDLIVSHVAQLGVATDW
jgi:hypothetical protein